MKSIKKYITFLILCVVIVLFVGCGENDEVKDTSEEKPVSLVILAGIHNNSKKQNIQLEAIIDEVYSNCGNIGVIVVDGVPKVVRKSDSGDMLGFFDEKYMAEFKKYRLKKSSYWKKHYLTAKSNELVKGIAQLKPDNEEVDTLAAFQEAEKVFNQMDKNNNKKIVIYDTGLSTSGSLNFLEKDYFNMNETQLDAVIQELYAKKELPDMNEVTVNWYGLGDVSEPQPDLSRNNIETLKTIWKMIIEKAGGEVEFIDIPSVGANSEELKVSVVYINNPSKETTTEVNVLEEIRFIANDDNYLYKNESEKTLENLASIMKNNSDKNWFIIGCTAGKVSGVTDEFENKLSRNRATRVMNTLVSFGVSKDNLKLGAMGSNAPWHIMDVNGDKLEESKAQLNRVVKIFSEDNEDYKKYSKVINNSLF